MEVNGVEFEEEESLDIRPVTQTKKHSFGEWLIKHKIAKDPLKANTIFLFAILFCLVVGMGSLVLGNKKPVGPSHSQQIQFAQMGKEAQQRNVP